MKFLKLYAELLGEHVLFVGGKIPP